MIVRETLILQMASFSVSFHMHGSNSDSRGSPSYCLTICKPGKANEGSQAEQVRNGKQNKITKYPHDLSNTTEVELGLKKIAQQ